MQSSLKYPDAIPFNLSRYARIVSLGKSVPTTVVSNDDIIRKYNLVATDRAVVASLGIRERRWAASDDQVCDFLCQAATESLEAAELCINDIDRIIYTRLLGDGRVPATSIRMLKKLGGGKGIPAIDVSAACSGFIHILDLAIRYIDSGDDYIMILAGDVMNRGSDKMFEKDTRTVFLNGDGVAAMIVGKADVQHFMASYLYTDNTFYHSSYIPFGSEVLNKTQKIDAQMFNMLMDGRVVYETVIKSAEIVAGRLMKQTGLCMDDIDAFVTCDQTTAIWQAQLQRLGVPTEKSHSLFSCYGNTIAAMAPLIFYEMVKQGRIKRGMTVMLMAHGAGASGGGMIFRY